MKGLMVAGTTSGSGKTTLTLALIALLQRQKKVASFKCGPDYIDSTFHQWAGASVTRQLDLFFLSEEELKDHFLRAAQGADVALVEGVMGYYDGRSPSSEEASSFHVARLLGIPCLLAMNPRGASLTLGAILKGLKEFREESGIQGFVLTPCSETLYQYLKEPLEKASGLKALGYLPPSPEMEIPSRRLGLDFSSLNQRLGREKLAEWAAKTLDLEGIWGIATDGGEVFSQNKPIMKQYDVHLGIARDEAFCFLYPDNLAILRAHGVRLTFFSPLQERIPDCDALWFPGGYPEEYTDRFLLETMKQVKSFYEKGGFILAEGGGLLYLLTSIDEKRGVGILNSKGVNGEKLQNFGYQYLDLWGETVPVHEFHFWQAIPSGNSFRVKRRGVVREEGFSQKNMMAFFQQLYLPAARGFLEKWLTAIEEKKHETRRNRTEEF